MGTADSCLGNTVTATTHMCILDINYWAFRGIGKREGADIKLPIGHVLRHNVWLGSRRLQPPSC